MIVDKPWGHEQIWALTDKYVGKVLHINEGQRLSLQYHRVKEETIYVLEGTLELVLEEGAEDLQQENEHYAITTPSAQFMNVVEALNRVHISLESSEITFLPDNYMPIEDASQAKVILKFIGALEDEEEE